MFVDYGFYKEHLISITKKGIEGAGEIKQMMINLRENPVSKINNQRVVMVEDYQNSIARNLLTNDVEKLQLPKSDVLIYYLEDGSKICARPSGTEPKIKFYFSVNTSINSLEEIPGATEYLNEKITNIISEMQLN